MIVNEKGLQLLAKGIIARLPQQKRMMYQYIESMEDQLAAKCETKEQFLFSLVEEAPYEQGAKLFGMSLDEFTLTMKEIEDEINNKLDQKIKNYKWIDYTNRIQLHNKNSLGGSKFFLLTM